MSKTFPLTLFCSSTILELVRANVSPGVMNFLVTCISTSQVVIIIVKKKIAAAILAFLRPNKTANIATAV